MEQSVKPKNRVWSLLINIIGGLLVGFVNGFFGGGGGMLCVPLLEKIAKEPTRIAHATAILVILPITIASGIMYLVGGFLPITTSLFVAIGVVGGGVGGALLLKVLPPKLIGTIFAVLMILAGIRMIV